MFIIHNLLINILSTLRR